MTRVRISFFSFVFLVAAAATASAQAGRAGGPPPCATLSCDILADWQRTAAQIIAIADRMPEDKWTFKPTPAQRTFGEQVLHIAQTDVNLIRALGGKTAAPAVDAGAAATKAASMAALRASFAYGEAVVKEFTDQQWLERINGLFMGPSVARLRVYYFDLAHTQDIYGQMAVYLRLNNLTPPASERGRP